MGSGRPEGVYCDLGHADSLAPRLLHDQLDDLDAAFWIASTTILPRRGEMPSIASDRQRGTRERLWT